MIGEPAGGPAAPAASVVVVTRDRSESLRRTLAALGGLASPGAGGYEVIVVDNGSTDDTARTVSDQGARYVWSPPGAGISASRQAGAEAARGAVVAFLDDDCVPDPDWLGALCRRLAAEPEVGLLGGRIDNVGFTGDRRFKGRQRLGPNGETSFVEDPRDADFYGNANLAFRRAALAAIGGYDPFFDVGRAEIDLAMSFRAAGYRVAYEPAAAVEHHHVGITRKRSRLFRGHQVMRLYFFFKHLPPRGARGWAAFVRHEIRLEALDLRRGLRALAAALFRRRPEGARAAGIEIVNAVAARLALPWLARRAAHRRPGAEAARRGEEERAAARRAPTGHATIGR